MLAVADFMLMAGHVLFTVFILCGWAFPRLRRLHLIAVLATAFSWVVLGAWYGWGYCFLTDWAWRIKTTRGERGLPHSFIEYGLEKLTGRDWDARLVYLGTAVAGVSVLVLAIFFWARSRTARTRGTRSSRPSS